MPKAIISIPLSPLHNLSAGDLADQLGSVKAEIAVLEAREKTLRDELIQRGVSECQGAAFGASVTEAVRCDDTARRTREGPFRLSRLVC